MLETILTWFIIGVVAGYFMYTKVWPALQRRKKPFRRVHLDSSSKLTTEQYKKVALGAIYSEMTHAYINNLGTGLDKTYIISTLLQSYWKLKNPTDAREKLAYLRDKGFRHYLPAVYRALMVDTPAEQETILENIFQDEEDLEKAYSQLQNLEETLPELLQDDVIQGEKEILKYGVIGWDCGRMVFLARLCYEARFISEAETWKYIDAASELARMTYPDWESYAKSYVLGRAMWGGVTSGNRDVAAIAKYLLEMEESPWNQLSWK
jgi:hypothetical protein